METKGKIAGIGVGGFVLIFTLLALFYGGFLTGGTQATHVEGVNYSNYGWYLLYLLAPVGLALIVTAYLVKGNVKFRKKDKAKKIGAVALVLFAFIGSIVFFTYSFLYVRAYADDSQQSDITLQTNAGVEQASIDLGNYTILSAHVSEYHEKDSSHYDDYRLLTFEDRWKIVIRMNNTAYWNGTGQNLTGVTSTLRGYALPERGATSMRPITGTYAPNTQIGATNYGDIDTVTYEGIPMDSRVAYFVFKILDSNGSTLGESYLHPRIKMEEMAWYMDTAI